MTNDTKFNDYTLGELQHYADRLLDRIEVHPNLRGDDYYRFQAYLENFYFDRVSLIEAIDDMQAALAGSL